VPLVASDALPALRERLELTTITPIVPPEPPRPKVVRTDPVIANTDAAPTEVPDGVAPEPEWQRDTSMGVNDHALVIGDIDTRADLEPPPAAAPPPPQPPQVVRPGSGIAPPTKIHDVAPIYPPTALAARIEGMVIIQATIGVDGEVVDATVLRTAPLLDQAALTAVRQWRYTPTRLNGVPVAVIMTVTVNFTLAARP
jgi:periplasmic protein TonB